MHEALVHLVMPLIMLLVYCIFIVGTYRSDSKLFYGFCCFGAGQSMSNILDAIISLNKLLN